MQQLEALSDELRRRGIPPHRSWRESLAITRDEEEAARQLDSRLIEIEDQSEGSPTKSIADEMSRTPARVRRAYYALCGAVRGFEEHDPECLHVLRLVRLSLVDLEKPEDVALIRETLSDPNFLPRAILAASYEGTDDPAVSDPYDAPALMDDTWRALVTDADERVRAALTFNRRAPILPKVDDPSPLVRAAHRETKPEALFALARHRDPDVALLVGLHVHCPESALRIVAYRARVPLGRDEPASPNSVSIACEHELGIVEQLETVDALARVPNYWDPDEVVDPSQTIVVLYTWLNSSGGESEASVKLQAGGAHGFTAAELLWAILFALNAKERRREPHFPGDKNGLGKQRCLFQLWRARDRPGEWRASLGK
jgi:hypothetical protein